MNSRLLSYLQGSNVKLENFHYFSWSIWEEVIRENHLYIYRGLMGDLSRKIEFLPLLVDLLEASPNDFETFIAIQEKCSTEVEFARIIVAVNAYMD